jgi:beta-glucosidase
VNARDPASRPTLFNGAVEGHVLVKNTNNSLPLKSPQLLSIYGYDAKSPDVYTPGANPAVTLEDQIWPNGLSSVNPLDVASYLEGLATLAIPQIAAAGTLWTGSGSGSTTPGSFSAPFDALQQRAVQNMTSLFYDFTTTGSTSNVDLSTDACLVFINAWATESLDRPGTHDDFSDALVNNIAAQCSNTIVIIHNAGIRLVDQFVENPNVTAIIYAHLPGQESGNAIVSLLYGEENFSGKLPYTVARNESDYGALYNPSSPEGDYLFYPQSNFSEGLYTDYRAFDQADITPRYEFGFGLSYTEFELADLTISKVQDAPASYPTGEVLQGGQVDLWDTVVNITVNVQNVGSVTGAEVVQLYLGIPGAPIKQLRGFDKQSLDPEEAYTATFELQRRDLSIWDTTAQKWLLQNGNYQVYVGTSSRNLPLNGTLTF